MDFSFLTDVGQVRTHNEDSGGVFKNDFGILAVVADGMGGHRAGDIASAMATDYFHQLWLENPEITSVKVAENWLEGQFKELNKKLHDYAEKNKECQGMGTTLVVALCTAEFVTIAHIGDSRAYIGNEFGFQQKTTDHSLVHELVRTGEITEDEAEHHPRKNVLRRALGSETELKMDITTLQVDEEQYVVLCSDGLTNKLTNEELSELINKNDSLVAKAKECIDLANERGGEDNITIALVHYPGQSEEMENEK